MKNGNLRYSDHALKRMDERFITIDVEDVPDAVIVTVMQIDPTRARKI